MYRDRLQIGSAIFEFTQPRVTCYRVGIRTGEPRMPALLTSSGRPGFYFRVLREGAVGAGDEIVKIGEANERITALRSMRCSIRPIMRATDCSAPCGSKRFHRDGADPLRHCCRARRRPARINSEVFNGGEALTPGVVGASARAPHVPDDDANAGPLVSFARSGIAAHWNSSAYQSILELAEACDVPVRWSCRTGVCHNCESGLVSGVVIYGPEPLDQPADGNLLICCSQPTNDVVIDL